MCQAVAQGCTFVFFFYSCQLARKTLVARFLGELRILRVPLASITCVLNVVIIIIMNLKQYK